MGAARSIPVWREMGAAPAPAGDPETLPVVIVGAGPVGLTLALDLARRGHRIVVLTRLEFIAAGSKAICFSKRSLEIFDRLGVVGPMLAKGVAWNVGKVFWGIRPAPIYQFDLLPVKDQKHPAFINLQQYYVEEHLVEALRRFPNVEIRWGHEVASVRQGDSGVHLIAQTRDQTYGLQAAWLIACDGSRSPVRDMMGLDFNGRTFEDHFLIADIRTPLDLPPERWFWFDPPFNPGQSALLHKQPDDVWRLDFQLGGKIDRDACLKPENVAALVRGMLGPDTEFTPVWTSLYSFQCRRLARFVHGRVVFAGDSAQLVSPFGARGCNGGIAAADNLGWKLDLVLRGEASPSLIESYNEEGIVTADENILNSSRATDFLTPKTTVSRAFRDAVLELAESHSFARSFVNSGRLSTAVSYPSGQLGTPDTEAWNGGPAPGSPPIDAPFASSWLLDRIGDQFALLADGWAHPIPTGVKLIEIGTLPDPALIRLRYDLSPGSAYLLRPDQYVAARWRAPTPALLHAALARAKGK